LFGGGLSSFSNNSESGSHGSSSNIGSNTVTGVITRIHEHGRADVRLDTTGVVEERLPLSRLIIAPGAAESSSASASAPAPTASTNASPATSMRQSMARTFFESMLSHRTHGSSSGGEAQPVEHTSNSNENSSSSRERDRDERARSFFEAMMLHHNRNNTSSGRSSRDNSASSNNNNSNASSSRDRERDRGSTRESSDAFGGFGFAQMMAVDDENLDDEAFAFQRLANNDSLRDGSSSGRSTRDRGDSRAKLLHALEDGRCTIDIDGVKVLSYLPLFFVFAEPFPMPHRVSRHNSSSTSGESNPPHAGMMVCKCAHALGKLHWPLDPGYMHLTGTLLQSRTRCALVVLLFVSLTRANRIMLMGMLWTALQFERILSSVC
jgi:hypothetical protein